MTSRRTLTVPRLDFHPRTARDVLRPSEKNSTGEVAPIAFSRFMQNPAQKANCFPEKRYRDRRDFVRFTLKKINRFFLPFDRR